MYIFSEILPYRTLYNKFVKSSEVHLTCFFSGGRFFCKCKANSGFWPNCDGTGCTQDFIGRCKQKNAQCVVDNETPTCVCTSKTGIYPNCGQAVDCTPEITKECRKNNAECDNGECVCKDKSNVYPECGGGQCTPQEIKRCQNNNAKCVQGEDGPNCVCSDGGTYPDCENTVDIGCFCTNGECIEADDGRLVCVCKNGGLPPNCLPSPPCQYNTCGNGQCAISPRGTPLCTCENGGIIPNCITGCNCERNEFCRFGKECTCLYGLKNGNCKTHCNKKCKNTEHCVVDPKSGEERCECVFDSSLTSGKCEKPKLCSKRCQENEICVINKDNSDKCVCSNLENSCPEEKCNNKKCNIKGTCAIIDRVATCICKNGAGTYPGCKGPCSDVNCNGFGKCIIEDNKGKCICK